MRLGLLVQRAIPSGRSANAQRFFDEFCRLPETGLRQAAASAPSPSDQERAHTAIPRARDLIEPTWT
jgi:hypothetical protein